MTQDVGGRQQTRYQEGAVLACPGWGHLTFPHWHQTCYGSNRRKTPSEPAAKMAVIGQKNYPTPESVSEVGHIWVGDFRGRKGRKLPQERRDWPQDGCQIEPEDAERAIVTKEIFEYEMGKANAFAYLGERVCYWEGYQRGLRRAYYGEVFGSQEEHERWMSFADDDKANEFQQERGRGYLDGLTARPRPPAPVVSGFYPPRPG